jgi:putative hydrolase of the HAD superfamily
MSLIGIKNIIFDLGGVILNIDFQKSTEAFKKLGFNDFDSFYNMAKQSELFIKFEKGEINAQEFRNNLRMFKNDLSDEQINLAWNAMILDIPKARIDLLLRLKTKYRTFLLSNTNEIHFKKYDKEIRLSSGLTGMDELFEKDYYSYKLGMRKPDKKIYEYVISENNLIPSETLFIDDSTINMEAAKQCGIKTYLIEKENDILNINFF